MSNNIDSSVMELKRLIHEANAIISNLVRHEEAEIEATVITKIHEDERHFSVNVPVMKVRVFKEVK